ncbi:MAG: hypothetical protein P8Y12_07015 [Gammaproteobacteria bacterium]
MQQNGSQLADNGQKSASLPNLPDQHNTGGNISKAEPEYRKLLAQWMFLDRGDDSQDSAHADSACFLSIE